MVIPHEAAGAQGGEGLARLLEEFGEWSRRGAHRPLIRQQIADSDGAPSHHREAACGKGCTDGRAVCV